MSIKMMALAGLLSLTAGAALAEPLTATLVTPVAKPVEFIAGSSVWNCEGSTCTTQVVSEQTLQGFGCRELTRQVGAVTVYGAFDGKRLAKCNAGQANAPVNAPAQTAQAATPATVAASH